MFKLFSNFLHSLPAQFSDIYLSLSFSIFSERKKKRSQNNFGRGHKVQKLHSVVLTILTVFLNLRTQKESQSAQSKNRWGAIIEDRRWVPFHYFISVQLLLQFGLQRRPSKFGVAATQTSWRSETTISYLHFFPGKSLEAELELWSQLSIWLKTSICSMVQGMCKEEMEPSPKIPGTEFFSSGSCQNFNTLCAPEARFLNILGTSWARAKHELYFISSCFARARAEV